MRQTALSQSQVKLSTALPMPRHYRGSRTKVDLVRCLLVYGLNFVCPIGVSAFYTGSIAKNSVAKAQAKGGIITLQDLKSKS